MLCAITGTFTDISGVVQASKEITIRSKDTVAQDGNVIAIYKKVITTSEEGDIAVSLYAGFYLATYMTENGPETFEVTVPVQPTGDWSDMITQGPAPVEATEVQRAREFAEAAATSADEAAADAEQTGLDRVATGEDAVATTADRVQTGLNLTQTGLDRVATGEDAVATAADRVQTGLDAGATAADRVQTGLDRTATGADADATAADRVQTGLDRTATGLDADATAADRAAIETSLLVYIADDETSLTIAVSDTMVVAEGTSPYPTVTLEFAVP